MLTMNLREKYVCLLLQMRKKMLRKAVLNPDKYKVRIWIQISDYSCVPFFGSSWQGSACSDRHAVNNEYEKLPETLSLSQSISLFGRLTTCGNGVFGRTDSPLNFNLPSDLTLPLFCYSARCLVHCIAVLIVNFCVYFHVFS